ncbi:MAG: HAD-IA family hydrolase [Clostridia bacterium]|nr:HAD-IA family hydrolase [Clostridia bacterium]
MKNYEWLIFDVDHTLLNYTADERVALIALFEENGLEVDEERLSRCQFLSEDSWTNAGLYNVQNAEIQPVWHKLYRAHVSMIFSRYFTEYGVQGKDAIAFGVRFLTLLERAGNTMPHAAETLVALKEKGYKIALATNGVSTIQKGRLRTLEGLYDKVFVSEEIGAIKPQAAFFESVLKGVGAKEEKCLMVGDSLSSDMLGAQRAGIDFVFYNGRKSAERPLGAVSCIDDLRELLALL